MRSLGKSATHPPSIAELKAMQFELDSPLGRRAEVTQGGAPRVKAAFASMGHLRETQAAKLERHMGNLSRCLGDALGALHDDDSTRFAGAQAALSEAVHKLGRLGVNGDEAVQARLMHHLDAIDDPAVLLKVRSNLQKLDRPQEFKAGSVLMAGQLSIPAAKVMVENRLDTLLAQAESEWRGGQLVEVVKRPQANDYTRTGDQLKALWLAHGRTFTAEELRHAFMWNLGALHTQSHVEERSIARFISGCPAPEIHAMAESKAGSSTELKLVRAIAADCRSKSSVIAPLSFTDSCKQAVARAANLELPQSGPDSFAASVMAVADSIEITAPPGNVADASMSVADRVNLQAARLLQERHLGMLGKSIGSYGFDLAKTTDAELVALGASMVKLGITSRLPEVHAEIAQRKTGLRQGFSQAVQKIVDDAGGGKFLQVKLAGQAFDTLIRRSTAFDGTELPREAVQALQRELIAEVFSNQSAANTTHIRLWAASADLAQLLQVVNEILQHQPDDPVLRGFTGLITEIQNVLGIDASTPAAGAIPPGALSAPVRSGLAYLSIDPQAGRMNAGVAPPNWQEQARKNLEDMLTRAGAGASDAGRPAGMRASDYFCASANGRVVPIAVPEGTASERAEAFGNQLSAVVAGNATQLRTLLSVATSAAMMPIRSYLNSPESPVCLPDGTHGQLVVGPTNTTQQFVISAGADKSVKVLCKFAITTDEFMTAAAGQQPAAVALSTGKTALSYEISITHEGSVTMSGPLQYDFEVKPLVWTGAGRRPKNAEDLFQPGWETEFSALHDFARSEFNAENLDFLVALRKLDNESDPHAARSQAQALKTRFYTASSASATGEDGGGQQNTELNIGPEVERVRDALNAHAAADMTHAALVALFAPSRAQVEMLVSKDTAKRYIDKYTK
ncbi:hypothetical protein BH11PSE7_BH11PSE7_06350 [soil metagenome]